MEALLEVGRLGLDKEFVDLQAALGWKEAEIHAHLDEGEEVKCFFGRDRMRVAEDAVGPADLVEQGLRALLEEDLAGVLLVLEDLGDDAVQPGNDLLLGLAEGGLVGDLEEIPHRLGPLAMEPADGQADLVDRVDDLVHLLGHDEAREVHHGACAHPGADIGGAGGEVAQLVVESEVERLLELRVGAVDHRVDLLELESGADRLHPEVILLVDHEAEGLLGIHHHGAARTARRMLAADEVTFHEDLLLERREILEPLGEGIFHLGKPLDRRADLLENSNALGFLGPARKGFALEVARETDAAADDDLVVWPRAAEPLAGVGDDPGEFHSGFRTSGGVSGRSARLHPR